LDFSGLRQFAPGSHHGTLLVRLRSPNRTDLIARIGELFQKENVSEWAGCFVVATERKIRVLKPERRRKPGKKVCELLHLVFRLSCALPFVVIPSQRSDEGSLFAFISRTDRPRGRLRLSLSS